jgi:hypothetical protein
MNKDIVIFASAQIEIRKKSDPLGRFLFEFLLFSTFTFIGAFQLPKTAPHSFFRPSKTNL